MLAADGHEIIDDEDEAEVIIVNTCCFIGDAKEESVNTILEMAEKKKAGTQQDAVCYRLHGTAVTRKKFQRKYLKWMPFLVQPLTAISARL